MVSYKDWVDEHRVAEVLQDLVRIPSVNPDFVDGNGERAVSAYVKCFFEELKLPYSVQPVEQERENVIGVLRGSSKENILFEAHMDTVQVQDMTIDPFEGTIHDGRLYGRGACDTKGSLAAMLVAIESITKRGIIPPVSIHVAAVVDEETSYKGVSFLANALKDGTLKYHAAIVGEPTKLDIIVAHKGVFRFHVDLHGSAAHTSMPEKGINAIEHMAEVITHLKSFAEKNYPQRMHPMAGAPTLCVTQIEGGVAPNTVAENCRITIDRRTVPGEDLMAAWEEIHNLLTGLEKSIPGLSIIVQKPFLTDYSLEVEPDHPFVRQLASAVNQYVNNRRVIGAPYCSDASKLAKVGIPTVVFGPGDIEQAHRKDEWIELSQVVDATAVLIDVVMQFGRGSEERRVTDGIDK